MNEKPSAAEQDFKEWWPTVAGAWAPGSNYVAKEAYFAATERTARRCEKISFDFNSYSGDVIACAIAKEFGLD